MQPARRIKLIAVCLALVAPLSLLNACGDTPDASKRVRFPVSVGLSPVVLLLDGFEENLLRYRVECDYLGPTGRVLPPVDRPSVGVTWRQTNGPPQTETRPIPFPPTCSTFRTVSSGAFAFPAQAFAPGPVTLLVSVEWYAREATPPPPPPLPPTPRLVGSVTATTARIVIPPTATAAPRFPTTSTTTFVLGSDRRLYSG